ncbi:hypothetical protein ACQPYK_29105 [Streptosporangium sp. CA-135522]|uniref:hypothetical protein n=1 Tax=Streptosporangium sp. CA-135522 TaxID=3240072 RepID=UPI003D9361DF
MTADWYREAAKWWLSVRLSTGHYVWSSVKSRLDHLKWFQWYMDQSGCAGPQLVDDPAGLRAWVRGFVESARTHRVMAGPNQGRPLSKNQVRQTLVTVETFYRWMYDNREEAAELLGEPRWKLLGPHHSVLFTLEDKPRLTNKLPDNMVLEDEVVSRIASASGLLAAPKEGGGLGDEQAFRALMLQLRTGRRMSEVLMMDFDPILPLLTTGQRNGAAPGDGLVARMKYQQTKIASSLPATIPVDGEIVEVIRAQQEWVRGFLASQGAPQGTEPRYLFVQPTRNRLGRLPYPSATYHGRLRELTALLDIRDSTGRPVSIAKTHTSGTHAPPT